LQTNGGVTANTEYHLKAFAFLHNRVVFTNAPPNLGESGGVYHFSQASNILTQRTAAPPAPPTLLSVTPNPETQLLPLEAGNTISYKFDMDIQYGSGEPIVRMIVLDEVGEETLDTIELSWHGWNAPERTDRTVIEITYEEDLAPGTQYKIAWSGQWLRNASATGQVMSDFFHIFTTTSEEMLTGNSFLTFSVNGIEATIDQSALTVEAKIPATMNLTDVEVVFTISHGATATVSGNTVTATHTMDFTNPVNYVVTSEAGEPQTYVVMITKEQATSIKDHKNISFEIFPNPVNNVLYIKAENLKQVEIIDMLGRSVIKKQANFERIVVSNLREGLYFIRLTTTDNRVVIDRFVKN